MGVPDQALDLDWFFVYSCLFVVRLCFSSVYSVWSVVPSFVFRGPPLLTREDEYDTFFP